MLRGNAHSRALGQPQLAVGVQATTIEAVVLALAAKSLTIEIKGGDNRDQYIYRFGFVKGLMRWMSLTLKLFKIGVIDGIHVGVEVKIEMRRMGTLARIRSGVTIGDELKGEEVFSDMGAIWEDMREKIATTIGVRIGQKLIFHTLSAEIRISGWKKQSNISVFMRLSGESGLRW